MTEVDDGHTHLVVDGVTSDYYLRGPGTVRAMIEIFDDVVEHELKGDGTPRYCYCSMTTGIRWADVMSAHPDHDRALTSDGNH